MNDTYKNDDGGDKTATKINNKGKHNDIKTA